MLYQPNFCCHCGDKIEREDWKFSNSRRFCDVCQSDNFVTDWLPAVFSCAMLLVGLFGVGSFLQAAGSRPIAVLTRAPANRAISNRSAANDAKPRTNSANRTPEPRQTPIVAVENVAVCGAITKKGTACTRRVKGGGRCWQHKDQAPDRTNSPRPPPSS